MTPPQALLPSQVGRYQVVRALGRGAMGQVLLARDPVLDRPVAIKHLRDGLSLGAEQLAALGKRMEQEARAAARVSHPNLVGLHDMGRDPIVGLFLVFEYVEGETLEERLKRGPLPPREAARLARELGAALSAAHAAQVLHRDVKPENVLLASTGAKLADFGIARVPGAAAAPAGGLLGTPAYGAPEAADEAGFSPASDQFSLACTLYEALCAQRAFPGDDAAGVAALVQSTEPPPLARRFGLSPRVDALLARALAKDPRARFPSCDVLGDQLADALEPGTQVGHARRRRASGGAAGAVLVAVALVVAVGFVYRSGWRPSLSLGPGAGLEAR